MAPGRTCCLSQSCWLAWYNTPGGRRLIRGVALVGLTDKPSGDGTRNWEAEQRRAYSPKVGGSSRRSLLPLLAMRKIWHFWTKALGPKQGATDKEADTVAVIRTVILLAYMVTNGFIVASSWRNLMRPPGIEPGSAAYKATALTNKQQPLWSPTPDSNRDCADFKSAASSSWASGSYHHCTLGGYACSIQRTAPSPYSSSPLWMPSPSLPPPVEHSISQ